MARMMRHPWWTDEENPFAELERGVQRRTGWPRGWGYQTQAKEWTPAIDMFDKGERLVLRAELPGVPQEAIDITLEKGILTIRGERKAEEEAEGDEWLCCERPSGAFYRAIQLPADIDVEQITAEHKDGVLTITLPKLAKKQPQKIAVKVG
jgi:HSP20 family protein